MVPVSQDLQPYRLPLLPFEKALIAELGWDEESYRFFAAETRRKAAVRPAEYDHIPDVQATGLEIVLINLAIGIALSAVSYLIAPKPSEPEKPKTKQLANRNGPSRFNSTYGFDSVAELALWGDPIPICFGKHTGYSGGIIVTPKLVWSRMFSYGSHQAIKALYTCGEWGIGNPNLKGIFLGTAPLHATYKHLYAIYFRRTPGDNRITANDLLYGSRGAPDAGDPETYDADIFSCPSRDAENDDAFSHVYIPSGNRSFGIYNPVANGTGLRAMWRVISRPEDEGDQGERTAADRAKICGWSGRAQGMPGAGREYVRGMGILKVNGTEYDKRTDVVVGVGDRILFRIAGGRLARGLYNPGSTGVTVDDLNSTLDDERAEADDLLQLGETIQIGRTSWRVIKRSERLWKPGGNKPHQDITLECIDTFGYSYVTAVPKDLIQDFDKMNRGIDFDEKNHIGLSSFPLARQAFGVVRNLRETDVLEIGIKSQVWNQASNMMNFNEVPEPEQLKKWDEDNVQVSGGVMSKYLLRTSAFTLKVRPAGVDPSTGAEYRWEGVGEQFCIRGRRPVDQFNFLRIYFPNKDQFEFRFEPLPGAVIIKAFQPTELFWHLDAKTQKWLTNSYDTPYGTFRITACGYFIAQADLVDNPETGYLDKDADYITTGYGPNAMVVDRYETSPYLTPHGKAHGWRNELLGFAQLYQGQTKSKEITLTSGFKTVKVKITCTSLRQREQCTPGGYKPVLYTDWLWDAPRVEIISASGGSGTWAVGDVMSHELSITRDGNNNNKWLHEAYTYGARKVKAVFTVTSVGDIKAVIPEGTNTRNFIQSSQCADVSYYPNEWRMSNSDSPEHEIAYVSEIRANEPITPNYYNMSMFGLVLKATKNFASLEQPRMWIPGGIQVRRWFPNADFFDDPGEIGRSNLFSDLVYWLLTDRDAGAGDVIHPEQVDEESFKESAKFLAVNRIFCDTALQDQVNIRQWVSENAPLHLLTFTLINGRYGLTPALPVTEAGTFNAGAVPVSAIFTEGNIIEDSFTVDYLDAQERTDFKAVVSYRQAAEFQMPQEFTATVRYGGPETGKHPIESFELASYCTQREQAVLTAKYLLALRKWVRHTVQFQTTPHGLNLAPGSYIRVVTQANPYSPVNNGVVKSDGGLVVANHLDDGTYPITYYQHGMDGVAEATMTVAEGVVVEPGLRDSVFTIRTTNRKSGVYQVQQITLTEEGLVEVVASEFPCDDQLRSLIVKDILDDQIWEVTE